ncbi:RTC2 Probable vacuolar amino acid transporter YPQ3 [Candida maltosa Xu316]
MGPPAPIILDAQAISGITGSISIACWIIVFAPQIYENFRRKSSEGLSLTFIVLWLAGDVFNVLGAVLQGVLPTMIILAVYYTLADIVLLWQCLVYGNGKNPDLIHLSPANPMSEDVLEVVISDDQHHHHHNHNQTQEQQVTNTFLSNNVSSSSSKTSQFGNFLINALMVALVIASGIIGWYVSYIKDSKHKSPGKHHHPKDLVFDPLAQAFGWLCALLYLGSRIPQIVLNYERKSVDGISFMFFLFACLGNLTYVISILSIDMSWNYLWVNSSWLAGSLGTLGLDFTIFVQFFIYNGDKSESESESGTESESLLTESDRSYGTS